MAVRIQLRRDTTLNWESNNPVLALGEIGLDTTTGNFKIGDGTSQWNDLLYFSKDVADVISQEQLDNAISAIGGNGLDWNGTEYDINLSSVGQDIIPSTDTTYDLGSSTNKWRDLYLSGNTIFLGDLQLKDNGDGTFAIFTEDGQSVVETVLLAGQVTDTELSDEATDIKSRFANHRDDTDNPHSVTAEQVGLGNVTNESKETMFADPTFTGTVSGVTAEMVGLGNVTNESKSVMFINAALTGTPTAPTASAGTNTNQIATTEFVQSEIDTAALALGTNYSVADITERNALEDLTVGDIVFVADDGDNKWAQYKVKEVDPYVFLKIMDQDIFLNALSAPDIKAAYESNADTNAFTDSLLSKLTSIEDLAKDDQLAEEVPYDNSYSLLSAEDVQAAIDEVEGRVSNTESSIGTINSKLEIIEGDSETEGSIEKALEDAKNYADAVAASQNEAVEISYDNTESNLISGNLQDAIDELHLDIETNQSDIDSVEGRLDIIEGDSQTEGSIEKALQDAKDYADSQDLLLNEAIEITYDETGQIYALGSNVQAAIEAIDSEMVSQDGRLDTIEDNYSTHELDSTIHFTQSQISITESQISDFGNYETADETILKSADIGVTVQGYDINTVVDANYETFNSSATYENLRAQATTAEDVGLENVENFGMATKEEAEAGTITDKYMNPLRTKEAILELSPPTDLTDVNNHIADTTIHFTQAQISITESQISDFGSYETADATILKSADIGSTVQAYNENTVVDANYETFDSSETYLNLRAQATTAEDVGLGDVENYGIALQSEAESGIINNKYMTPLRTAQAIASQVSTQLSTGSYLTQTDFDDQIGNFGGTGITWDSLEENYDLDFASLAEVEAGTETDKVISPFTASSLVIDGGDF